MKRIVSLVIGIALVISVGFSVTAGKAQAATPAKNPKYKLEVDVRKQRVRVYVRDDQGNYNIQIKNMICSTGKPSTPTRRGTFVMGSRKVRFGEFVGMNCAAQYWTHLTSRTYFHSILYRTKNTSTLISSSVRNLGKAVSHGCIRLEVKNARWIYVNCNYGTIATVASSFPSHALIRPEKTMPYAITPTNADVPIRKSDNYKSAELGKAVVGSEYRIVEKGRYYYKIRYKGKDAFISVTNVKEVNKLTGYWATVKSKTKLLNEPNGKAMAQSKTGDRFGVLLKNAGKGYSVVYYKGKPAYIKTSLLQFDIKGGSPA